LCMIPVLLVVFKYLDDIILVYDSSASGGIQVPEWHYTCVWFQCFWWYSSTWMTYLCMIPVLLVVFKYLYDIILVHDSSASGGIQVPEWHYTCVWFQCFWWYSSTWMTSPCGPPALFVYDGNSCCKGKQLIVAGTTLSNSAGHFLTPAIRLKTGKQSTQSCKSLVF